MIFSKSINNWPLSHNETLNLVHIETKGRDLSDFLSNAEVSIEDWHGNQGPDYALNDLSDEDQALVEQMFTEHLQGVA